ncbi:MAG: hypothetical protein WCP28_10045 [Actinomycetes bacterium]
MLPSTVHAHSIITGHGRRASAFLAVGTSTALVLCLAGTGAANAAESSPPPTSVPQGAAAGTDSTPPLTSDGAAAPGTAVAVRGDVVVRAGKARVVVATPRPGQTSIVRMIVEARTVPKIGVTAVRASAGTQKVTVVGGTKRVSSARAGSSQYAVTVPIIKPRVKGASGGPGQLALVVKAIGLRVVSQKTYTKAFTQRVSGEMCQAVSAFDLANRDPQVRAAFNKKVLFGRQMPGFRHAQYLGSYALLQACVGNSSQSFINAVTGKRAASANTRTLQMRADSPAINTAPGTTDAVVLVSGFASDTPFTSPGKVCTAPNMSAGGTWSTIDAALQAAGVPVFTVPETEYKYGVPNAPVPVQVDPAAIGVGTCAQPQLPATMTMDTAGDFDLNSSILANYLGYIHAQFGVQRVWLIGHSDGGLWSRGAMDYTSFMPGIQVQSITTIDTPWTGSFLANAGQHLTKCGTLDFWCQVKAAAFTSLINYVSAPIGGGAALDEMTATYMTKWNLRMAGVAGATPFYAASSVGINDPRLFSGISSGTGSDPFYNPNDVAVGLSSQQAKGLVANGTISVLQCFQTVPGLHTQIPGWALSAGQDADLINTFPGRTAFPTSTTAVTVNPMTITNITNVLNGSPPTSTCPSANYQQSGEYAPGQFGPWPND